MAFTFDPIFAADPSNAANVASNASILIFNPADAGKAPITITDVTGAALPNPITVNKNGFGPAFTSTLDRVSWSGGGFTGFFTSYEGIKAVATAAQAAAEAAAATAGTDAAAVATAAIGTATDDAAASAASASASATAAANAAALVGAPADAAITAAINSGASATSGALKSNFMPKWQPNTVYLANDKVLSPNGDVLSAKINFTSGATYNPANWDLPLSATYIDRATAPATFAVIPGSQVADNQNGSFRLGTNAAPVIQPAALNAFAVGTNALANLTTGINNIAIGQFALEDVNLTGPNMAIGHEAGRHIQGSDSLVSGHNIAIGLQSQRGGGTTGGDGTKHTGYANNSVGIQTLWVNTTGKNNQAFGFSALRYNTTGNDNVALGHNALNLNTTGFGNIGVGTGAGASATTAVANTSMGNAALTAVTTGSYNTAIGYSALLGLTGSSQRNVAMGWEALKALTGGNDNVAVGGQAGKSSTTGSANVFIGKSAGDSDGTTATGAAVTSSVAIGFMAQATANNVFVVGSTLAANRLSLCIGNYGVTGGGKGLVSLSDAATVPTTNPTGGGLMYSEGGALKWRGSAGTVTVIAPA